MMQGPPTLGNASGRATCLSFATRGLRKSWDARGAGPGAALVGAAWEACGAGDGRTVQRRVARIMVGHVTPEASEGPERSPLALVEDGDTIRIDAREARLDLVGVDGDELRRRRERWEAPAHLKDRQLRGVFRKYVDSVSSAHTGAVTY